jgi:hypothetical protein
MDTLSSWHGRAMVLAWGFALPLGVLIARFFKIMPRQDWPNELDNRVWWRSHLILQWCGTVMSIVGLVLIVIKLKGELRSETLHHLFGWATLALLCVQILGGVFRGTTGGPTQRDFEGSLRGDHFDMTVRREIFEVVHKFAGYLALVLGAGAVVSGLWAANGPIWMWIGIALWWGALVVTSLILQRQKRAYDTYQAIWGPSPDLPGNKTRPIGIGVFRKP